VCVCVCVCVCVWCTVQNDTKKNEKKAYLCFGDAFVCTLLGLSTMVSAMFSSATFLEVMVSSTLKTDE